MKNSFQKHNHKNCISTSISKLEQYSLENNKKITKIRRKVLEILLESHKALGAYEILEKLRYYGFSSQPPIAYRALNYLQKIGFVHKIENLNAFIACTNPGKLHEPAFLICRKCKIVSETIQSKSYDNLFSAAKNHSFSVENSILEVIGVCENC